MAAGFLEPDRVGGVVREAVVVDDDRETGAPDGLSDLFAAEGTVSEEGG
jgi:hypothetical protein